MDILRQAYRDGASGGRDVHLVGGSGHARYATADYGQIHCLPRGSVPVQIRRARPVAQRPVSAAGGVGRPSESLEVEPLVERRAKASV